MESTITKEIIAKIRSARISNREILSLHAPLKPLSEEVKKRMDFPLVSGFTRFLGYPIYEATDVMILTK